VTGDATPIIDGGRLRSMLLDSGWTVAGEREGLYVRLRPDTDDGSQGSLLIPTNPESSDYADLLAEAMRTLRTSHSELWTRLLLPQLSTVATDAFRFRKESAAPPGLIPWEQGSALIDSARAMLIAGAKAYMGPVRHYNNKFGRFASRYLDTVYMGQTAVGSYVVTAYAPVQSRVPLRSTKDDNLGYDGVDAAPGRDVSSAVVDALDATVSALSEARSTREISSFEHAVEKGVSFELLAALATFVEGAIEAEVSVEWDRSVLLPEMVRPATSFVFRGDDIPILNRAASALATPEPPVEHSADGWVHLLTKKEAGGPGVFGVDSGKRKYRVRLQNPEDLSIAVNAYDDDAHVRVSGMLERDGTISWLYNATVVRLEPVQPEPVERLRGRAVGAQVQRRLFDDDGLAT
jgi:hypothetical protein